MDALTTDVERLSEIMQRGDAKEETFYPVLETLIKTLSDELDHQSDVTTLPKRTEAGNPDFRVWNGRHQVTCYHSIKLQEEIDERYQGVGEAVIEWEK